MKPTIDNDTVFVPYPRGFTSWEYIKLNVGDITIEELINILPKVHHGVKPTQMFKANLSEADIAAGKGQALFVNTPDIVPTAALNMLKRPNLSDRIREVYEKQVRDAETMNAMKRETMKKKVIDAYREIYGDLPHPSFNFIVLDGAYDVPEQDNDLEKVQKEFNLKLSEEITTVKANIPKVIMYFPPEALKRPIATATTTSS